MASSRRQSRAFLVHEPLKRIETGIHFGRRRRRHEERIAGTCAADPVLRTSGLSESQNLSRKSDFHT